MLMTMVLAISAGIMVILLSRQLNVSAIVLLLCSGVLLGPEGVGLVRSDLLGDMLKVECRCAQWRAAFDPGIFDRIMEECMAYQKYLLPEKTSDADYRAVVRDYEQMLIAVMRMLADRFDASYPFVNTKLNLISGDDFDIGDPIRGRNAVYGWIQGRGLEALAGHCRWFQKKGLADDLLPRLEDMMRLVLHRLRRMWQKNGNRLWFFMRPDGSPFVLTEDGRPDVFVLRPDMPYGFSDLFSAKGMYATACYLDDHVARQDALAYIEAVDEAIWSGRFENDQVTLDPQNPVVSVPGCTMHGPFMIQIGTAALLVQQGMSLGVDMGFRLIAHELTHYVNLDGRVPGFDDGDLWEAIDMDGQPYRDGQGVVLSDLGHALEFVGLALKFTKAAKASGLLNEAQKDVVARFEQVMPQVLQRNFENGFLGKGICKAFDLVARKPLNTDLPWWNLPETMRAAILCGEIVTTDQDRALCTTVFRQCHNAFVQYFVRPDLMAYQTITEAGEPVSVIPATADADPGYHTGLSIIDVLDGL